MRLIDGCALGESSPIRQVQLAQQCEETWLSTVRTEMNSCAAISALLQ